MPPRAWRAEADARRVGGGRQPVDVAGLPVLPGYCNVTKSGWSGKLKCSTHWSGSWRIPLPPSLTSYPSRARQWCLERCSECERCAFISVSVAGRDCSWFAHCETSALQTAASTDHVTTRVRADDGSVLPPVVALLNSSLALDLCGAAHSGAR